MVHTNARGTFLVRESEQNPGGFALSIKDWDNERAYHVKHYKIKPLDNNRGFYITTRQTFASLQELVKGYQSTLCKGKYYKTLYILGSDSVWLIQLKLVQD